MATRSITLLVLLLMMGSCAKLSVTVDVLNPEVVETRAEEDYINASIVEVLAADEAGINQKFLDIKNDHYKAYEESIRQTNVEIALLDDIGDSTLIRLKEKQNQDARAGWGNILTVYSRKEAQWRASVTFIKELYSRYDTTDDMIEKKALQTDLVIQLQTLAALTDHLEEFVNKDLDKDLFKKVPTKSY